MENNFVDSVQDLYLQLKGARRTDNSKDTLLERLGHAGIIGMEKGVSNIVVDPVVHFSFPIIQISDDGWCLTNNVSVLRYIAEDFDNSHSHNYTYLQVGENQVRNPQESSFVQKLHWPNTFTNSGKKLSCYGLFRIPVSNRSSIFHQRVGDVGGPYTAIAFDSPPICEPSHHAYSLFSDGKLVADVPLLSQYVFKEKDISKKGFLFDRAWNFVGCIEDAEVDGSQSKVTVSKFSDFKRKLCGQMEEYFVKK